jgi:AbrB family looped-hinge helix DNA binding protein
MHITSKGQVTIPKEIREAAGLLPETEVEFVMSRGRVILRKRAGINRRGAMLIKALRGRGTVKMTTDEIMALTRGE